MAWSSFSGPTALEAAGLRLGQERRPCGAAIPFVPGDARLGRAADWQRHGQLHSIDIREWAYLRSTAAAQCCAQVGDESWANHCAERTSPTPMEGLGSAYETSLLEGEEALQSEHGQARQGARRGIETAGRCALDGLQRGPGKFNVCEWWPCTHGGGRVCLGASSWTLGARGSQRHSRGPGKGPGASQGGGPDPMYTGAHQAGSVDDSKSAYDSFGSTDARDAPACRPLLGGDAGWRAWARVHAPGHGAHRGQEDYRAQSLQLRGSLPNIRGSEMEQGESIKDATKKASAPPPPGLSLGDKLQMKRAMELQGAAMLPFGRVLAPTTNAAANAAPTFLDDDQDAELGQASEASDPDLTCKRSWACKMVSTFWPERLWSPASTEIPSAWVCGQGSLLRELPPGQVRWNDAYPLCGSPSPLLSREFYSSQAAAPFGSTLAFLDFGLCCSCPHTAVDAPVCLGSSCVGCPMTAHPVLLHHTDQAQNIRIGCSGAEAGPHVCVWCVRFPYELEWPLGVLLAAIGELIIPFWRSLHCLFVLGLLRLLLCPFARWRPVRDRVPGATFLGAPTLLLRCLCSTVPSLKVFDWSPHFDRKGRWRRQKGTVQGSAIQPGASLALRCALALLGFANFPRCAWCSPPPDWHNAVASIEHLLTCSPEPVDVEGIEANRQRHTWGGVPGHPHSPCRSRCCVEEWPSGTMTQCHFRVLCPFYRDEIVTLPLRIPDAVPFETLITVCGPVLGCSPVALRQSSSCHCPSA